MVERIVVHFGENGGSTVTIWPDRGVRGVLFDGPFTLPNIRRSSDLRKLDGRADVTLNGTTTRPSEMKEARIGACYVVEDGPEPEVICW